MNILGPEELVFGVDDLAGCTQYLTDYGLNPLGVDAEGGRFEALDGSAVVLRLATDPLLPPPMGPAPSLRETVYGVADQATLEAIAAELGRDREVRRDAQGGLHSVDDMGFALGFRVSRRRPISTPAVRGNAPGAAVQRAVNQQAVVPGAGVTPLSLSHIVYFVPDVARAERFYVERLGFRPTDRFTGVGPFLQPQGTLDHHTLFMIQTPPFMKGVDHFTFHLASGTDVLHAGTRFVGKGYQSFWGPGRHIFGSNWFWYFNSPLGCKMEYDADMDLHDASWQPREVPMGADNSQLFLFERRDKWAPGGPPAGAKPGGPSAGSVPGGPPAGLAPADH